jgi:hypothetical protein
MAVLASLHIPLKLRPVRDLILSLYQILTIVLEATSIVGTVAHECTLTPVMTTSYTQTVKNRVQVVNRPKRQVQMLSHSNAIPNGSYLYNPKSNQPFGKFTGVSTD